MPKSDGWFKPGESGNPGGRPKNAGQAKTLARQAAGQAIFALLAQLHDHRIAARERRAAAKMLLRIGFGKQNPTGTTALQELGWKGVYATLLEAGNADQAARGNANIVRMKHQGLR